jgi:uracil-DNA glycosylase
MKQDPWQALERKIITCGLCPRLRTHCREVAVVRRRAYLDEEYWGQPITGFGDRDARLLIVGLAPGAHGANRTGRVFTGDSSGDFLFAALHRHGIANQPVSRGREDGLILRGAFVSAAARCAPPKNRPDSAEIERCRPYLVREMRLLANLRGILALGGIAWIAVRRALEETIGPLVQQPSFGHGMRWLPQKAAAADSLVVFASYHPSRQNTQTGHLTAAMFDHVIAAAARESGLP